jgi:hypothetical protein
LGLWAWALAIECVFVDLEFTAKVHEVNGWRLRLPLVRSNTKVRSTSYVDVDDLCLAKQQK